MTQKAAILGLGQSGAAWAHRFHTVGWQVTGFDPEPLAEGVPQFVHDWRRENTISATVRGSDWVLVCVPDRLELMRKVIQRAQAEAPEDAVVAVATRTFSVEEIQGCAHRPGCVIRVSAGEDGGYFVDVNADTDAATRADATSVLAELAAMDGIGDAVGATKDQEPDAESA